MAGDVVIKNILEKSPTLNQNEIHIYRLRILEVLAIENYLIAYDMHR